MIPDPPALAVWLLHRLRSNGTRDVIIGDLVEEFSKHVVEELGVARARRWFWRQTLNVLMHRPRTRRVDVPITHTKSSHTMVIFLRDIRVATRGLLRTPGFALVAVATLALGIGSNTAVFSVVRGVLLSPLPYAEPDRLVRLGGSIPGLETGDLSASPAELDDYQTRAVSFTGITAVWPLHANLVGGDMPLRISVAGVTPEFFDVLGVRPAVGRLFRPEEMHLGIGLTTVISWSMWQTQFGGRDDTVGKIINIDGDPVEIVGVMPRGFHHPGQPLGAEIDMWSVFDISPGGRFFFRNGRPLQLFGRLAPDVSIDGARAELALIADALRAEYPASYPEGSGWNTGVEPLRTTVVGGMEQVLFIVFGAVGFVLLVACANVSALLVTRGSVRARQTAIRLAVGGTRGDVIRFQLAESLVLSLVGGVCAIVLAVATTGLLRSFAVQFIPRAEMITLDLTVPGFALLVAAVVGVVFGVAPAIAASLTSPLALLNDGARGAGRSVGWLRDGMVIGEIAVSTVLVVASGLLVRSFDHLLSVDMGFDPTGVKVVQTYLPVQVDPNEGVYRSQPNRIRFYTEVLRRLDELPSVQATAGISHLPLRATSGVRFSLADDTDDGALRPTAEYRVISERYFEVMSIPLQRGRAFTVFDDQDTDLVAIVNQAWVDHHANGRDPVGLRIRVGNTNNVPIREIVGVVGDVRLQSLEAGTQPTIYAPYLQVAGHNMTFVFQSDQDAAPLLDAARGIVQQVDPNQPVFGTATMDDVVAASVAERRVLVWMVSLFGVLALLLAALGVFGVVSFRARQRRREIGIRIALGANQQSVVRLILKDGLRLAAIGAGLGLVGAAFMTRVLESMLFGTERLDPVVFSLVLLTSLAVAALAGFLPARRASTTDPLVVLRSD